MLTLCHTPTHPQSTTAWYTALGLAHHNPPEPAAGPPGVDLEALAICFWGPGRVAEHAPEGYTLRSPTQVIVGQIVGSLRCLYIWDNYKDYTFVGTLDGLYQHTLIATGMRLRPAEATFLGHILGTTPAKNRGCSGRLRRFYWSSWAP